MNSNNQRGQALIVIVIFGLLLWSFYSIKFPKIEKNTVSTIAGIDPNPVTEISQPKISDDLTAGDGKLGPIEGTSATYKLCAANVKVNKIIPPDDESNPNQPYFNDRSAHTIKTDQVSLQGKSYQVYFPGRWGEISAGGLRINNGFERDQSGNVVFDFTNDADLRFRQQKIIYLVYLDSSGKPIEGIGKNAKGEAVSFFVVNFYRDTTAPPLPKGAFCSDSAKSASLSYPPQNSSPDKTQLQLQYFAFKDEVLNVHCKPAIYLYPENEISVNVKVKTRGKLIYTDPKYPEKTGWTTLAKPDGNLIVDGKNYDYLYYESQIPNELIDVPNSGYVSSFEDLPKLYDLILPKLGLNLKQSQDFKEYWLKTLPFSNYYFVGVINQSNINDFEPLEITPKPDSLNRVRIYFKALDKRVDTKIPTLSAPKMSGFKLVEWGGMFKSDPTHPFTCSQ